MPDASPLPRPGAPRYRMPAEWAPHRATWFSWPHNPETWPDELPAVEAALAGAVKALADGETVHVGVLDDIHRRHVGDLFDAHGVRGDVRLHVSPTNDAWARDHGAIFVRDTTDRAAHPDGALVASLWGFDSWGGKYPHELDAAVNRRMAEIVGVPTVEGGMILEGGSIDVNGAGVLLTTEACLLGATRNPGMTREAMEARMRDVLGATTVVWLGDGIVGDDTDGHVDDLTRFVDEQTVVTAVEADPADVNHDALAENLERLHALRVPDGSGVGAPLRVIELPMPAPVVSKGERLPASYANFYIGNRVVLLPVFDDPNDAIALATLTPLFPGRTVVPVPSRDVVWGLGSLHCLTQQIPA